MVFNHTQMEILFCGLSVLMFIQTLGAVWLYKIITNHQTEVARILLEEAQERKKIYQRYISKLRCQKFSV